MFPIPKRLMRVFSNTTLIDTFIKVIEFGRGLYRYPQKMIGRKMPPSRIDENTDVLILAAHPDDEILGLGTSLYRHCQKGDKVTVAYVTNGTAVDDASWKINFNDAEKIANTRFIEGVNGLSLIGINEKNIFCLGYPDRGTQRYLKNIAKDVHFLIQSLKPKIIYVHCIEGGHSDHDIVSFLVKSVCKNIGFSNLYEWTEYHKSQPLGTMQVNFSGCRPTEQEETMIKISKDEQLLKKKMLACHKSQGVVMHYKMGEAIRKTELSDLNKEFYTFSGLPQKRFNSLLNGFTRFISKNETFKITQSKQANLSSRTLN